MRRGELVLGRRGGREVAQAERLLRIAEDAVRAAWSLWQNAGFHQVDRANIEVTRALWVWIDARRAAGPVAAAADVAEIYRAWKLGS